jgi:transcriptional regulator with XRE-family HTH domain
MPPLSPEHEAFGRALRMLRARHNLSQEALAGAAGLDRSYVGAVERGEANVGYATLHRLARAFKLRASELVRRAEDEADVAIAAAPPGPEHPGDQ